MNVYTIFKLMYFALDSKWEKDKDGDLGQYLSEMNPFLWNDEGSADPEMYSKFKSKFQEKFNSNECSVEESYNFTKNFLEADDNINAKKALSVFSNISLDEWIEASKNI